MNLSGRLALGVTLPVVAILLALGLIHGASWSGLGLAVGAIAVVLMIAEIIARSLSKPLAQAVEGLSRGEPAPVSTASGHEIARLTAALADLSAQLGSRQNLLETTVESIRDLVVIADETGAVVVVNAAARQLFGIDAGFNSLTGVRSFECYYADGVTPMPIAESPLVRALRGEDIEALELVVKPRSGAPEVCLVANSRPLRDDAGNLRGAVSVLHDVTARRQAHAALVESEQMAQAIISTALDAFVQTDQDGIVLDWSPQAEALTGWTRSEAVGCKVVELVVPEELRVAHRQRITRFLQETAAGGMGMRYESPSVHRDGHLFYVEVSLNALKRGDGYVVNAFVRDITQRRVAAEQLIQAQKTESLGRLTGGIAHDFNNMLTVITGTIELLADGVKDNPQLAAIAKLISDAADRGAQLTSSLLAFSRKQPLQPAETYVNELIGEVVRLLSQTLGSQIEIRTELRRDAWLAFVDRSQLSAALVNLGINARDAMPEGGTVTFATRNVQLGIPEAVARGVERAGDHLVIEVTDTGVGISPSHLEKIFDPFFSTKEVGRGTGLGLSMVFGFVKQSGGGIEVRSEEGRGTIFRIYLPKADGVAPRADEEDEAPVRGGTETILCVEDDVRIREYVTGQLESLGYKVLVAANADEALAIVRRGTAFDLLFTDIVMPGSMNGRQLAETLMAGRPAMRVLFTSGYSDGALPTQQGRGGHGIPLLTKPYRRSELARMLRRCLDLQVDFQGDPVPQPYSVLPDLERFLRENPPDKTDPRSAG
ncbi:hybrid sensor histidine kinase/response regulator [Bradyrhizobium ivorense]|uniref:hybrid sensor histidine kinase/response regulator n=1 Tax=Bradyrhizobium ivorense TaxID=2511166 RepID=UPI0010B49EF3|nr:PAS domain S-box protein [Bradyrhizobium ivorense]VIO73810.1 Blue-light-activated protein [Bradyrhizobium ivorense]